MEMRTIVSVASFPLWRCGAISLDKKKLPKERTDTSSQYAYNTMNPRGPPKNNLAVFLILLRLRALMSKKFSVNYYTEKEKRSMIQTKPQRGVFILVLNSFMQRALPAF